MLLYYHSECMTSIEAIILGVVEGITEFLPISSTGHLIITGHFLSIPESTFLTSFEIIIQMGAMLAVLFLYLTTLYRYKEIIGKIVVASIPVAVVGFLLYDFIKDTLLQDLSVLIWALGIGGVIFVLFELLYKKPFPTQDLKSVSYFQAMGVGLFQIIALIPGVSRAAATMLGGMSIGMNRKTSVEFSFLLGVPVILGAGGLDLLKTDIEVFQGMWSILLLGCIVSAICAYISMRWLISFVQHHSFLYIGIYRIGIAVVLAILFL